MGTSSKDSQRRGGAARQGRAPGARSAPPTTFSALLRAFEADVIPTLLKVNEGRPLTLREASERLSQSIKPGDVSRLASVALEADPGAVPAVLHAVRARGVTLEALFLELLAPAARKLGTQWERDEIDFVAVTSALGRILQAVRELSALIPPRLPRRSTTGAPRILLSVTPGEQHNLGVLMVAEFFRREGWEVTDFASATLETLVMAVERTAFDLIGLSLGGEVRLNALVSTIEALRTASKNPDVGVMVGGAIFALQPDLARRVPADAVAADAASAVRLAQAILRRINLRLRASRSTEVFGSPTHSPTH